MNIEIQDHQHFIGNDQLPMVDPNDTRIFGRPFGGFGRFGFGRPFGFGRFGFGRPFGFGRFGFGGPFFGGVLGGLLGSALISPWGYGYGYGYPYYGYGYGYGYGYPYMYGYPYY